ncbi:MAG: Do family serine endopeptidase, partial [Gammaproteobacteria bacterium]|nr:Do family serine endopeptidase [Gammaproteobacteria bacterium]
MYSRFLKFIELFLISIFMMMPAVARAALPLEIDNQKLPSLAPMLEEVTPAVVNIATEGKIRLQTNPLFSDPFFQRFFNFPNMPAERKTQSLGSGVIVDAKRGLILTNNHVIANAHQITVTLRDGRQLDAELVGTDPETDVAVIKVPPKNLTDIKAMDSDTIRVGDFVVAIGNPFGLGQTVTSGIISALSRSGLGIEGYEDFIQTDASINPGNSGGALVNLRGELVGINTAIFSQSGGNIGIGFAIPANLALNIMEQLLETGKVERGFLGVQAQDLSPELAEAFGLDKQHGAVINRVLEGSPAEKAGFKAGDVVIKVDG